ncbi:MAG TPA: type IV pilus assembly protein PilM [bacterium]|nr:type IV pilus assembly protein PilM [bacterium]
MNLWSAPALKPVELLGPPLTVGVDLGRRTIKVAAVRGRKHLVHAAIYPTPDGALDGGTVRNARALAPALRMGLRSAGIRSGRAVVAMGGRTALVRTFMLPPMPQDELKSAVKWEAERHLPLRIDEAVLDAQVVREVTEDGQRRVEVLMAAVPERDALAFYEVAHGAGLDVAALEVSSLALTRVLADTGAVTAAVDIGADATEIVIVHGALPPVCRSLPIGADQLSAAADVPATAPEPASPAPGWHELLEGLTLSIEYFQAQAHREKVERVVLTGEGAELPDATQLLTAGLGVPVMIGDPCSRLTVAAGLSERLGRHRASLAVAIGLALRSLH